MDATPFSCQASSSESEIMLKLREQLDTISQLESQCLVDRPDLETPRGKTVASALLLGSLSKTFTLLRDIEAMKFGTQHDKSDGTVSSVDWFRNRVDSILTKLSLKEKDDQTREQRPTSVNTRAANRIVKRTVENKADKRSN